MTAVAYGIGDVFEVRQNIYRRGIYFTWSGYQKKAVELKQWYFTCLLSGT